MGYVLIKKATELWGPYGSNWKLDNIKHEELPCIENGTIVVKTSGTFCYPGGCFAGFVAGKLCYMTTGTNPYLKVDEDIYKKNETDLITKCLSRLGFNADVFLGKFDDNKYVAELKREEAAAAQAKPKRLPNPPAGGPKDVKNNEQAKLAKGYIEQHGIPNNKWADYFTMTDTVLKWMEKNVNA